MLFIASYYIPATTHCQDTGTEILSATQDTGTEILSAVQDTGTEILSCCQDSISVPVSDILQSPTTYTADTIAHMWFREAPDPSDTDRVHSKLR